jgi:hypothetical protein
MSKEAKKAARPKIKSWNWQSIYYCLNCRKHHHRTVKCRQLKRKEPQQ